MQNLITMASGTLNEVYSGTEIATLFAEYGAEFNSSVPFISTPFRTLLLRLPRFKIIYNLSQKNSNLKL